MGDLKTNWHDPAYGNTTNDAGDLAIGRGSDPNADGNRDHPAGLVNFWEDSKQALSEQGVPTEESANSVSGLPKLPNRFQPAEGRVEPPSLQDRNPGTIDKR